MPTKSLQSWSKYQFPQPQRKVKQHHQLKIHQRILLCEAHRNPLSLCINENFQFESGNSKHSKDIIKSIHLFILGGM